QKFVGQGQPVGVHDGLPTVPAHHFDDLQDLGVQKGFAPGDADAVDFPQGLDDLEFLLDDFQGLVAVQNVLVVTALAGQVALGGDFQPEDPVVAQGPGHPV